MELEFLLHGTQEARAYAIPLHEPASERPSILDWRPMIGEILAGVESGTNTGLISARFHNGLAEGIVAVAKKFGEKRVVLSGGCFQNRYLCERSVFRLREEGFCPYWHQRVPPNDGGIALGRIVGALRSKASAID